MAIRKIFNYGHPVLRQKAAKIHKVSAKVVSLVHDMLDTMYASDGVGLAAPQIAESKQLFIVDTSPESQSEGKPAVDPIVFINPVIIKKSGAMVSWEGCLSFPEVFIDVRRYRSITVRYTDMQGRSQVLTAENNLLCRAIQHELDHLNGILFIDHVIDRFGADAILQKEGLPMIDPSKLLDEAELDALLKDQVILD